MADTELKDFATHTPSLETFLAGQDSDATGGKFDAETLLELGQFDYIFEPTDTSADIVAAVSGAADGSAFFFKNGTYTLSATMTLDGVGKSMIGESMDQTKLVNDAGRMLQLDGDRLYIANLQLCTSGEINPGSIVFVNSAGGVGQCTFERVLFDQNRLGSQIFEHLQGEVTELRIKDCAGEHSLTSTINSWLFRDAGDVDQRTVKLVHFENYRHSWCGDYVFLIEAVAGSTSGPSNIVMSNMFFFNCPNGLINARGVRAMSIRGMEQGGYTANRAAHLLRFEGTSNAREPDCYVTLEDCKLGGADSDYDGGIKDIYIDSHRSPKRSYVFMKNIWCDDANSETIRVDYNDCKGITEVNCQITDRIRDGEALRVYESGIENARFTGTVYLDSLPTTDPGRAGQLWNDGGTLKVSTATDAAELTWWQPASEPVRQPQRVTPSEYVVKPLVAP